MMAAASSTATATSTSSIPKFVFFLFLFFASSSIVACHALSPDSGDLPAMQKDFQPVKELQRLRSIREHLKRINKAPVKTILSRDGDLIDCIVTHQQPAFDHPQLRGQKPSDPPQRPKGDNTKGMEERFQLWQLSGETCPEGTIPVRRTTEQDMLRASSIRSFGRKATGYGQRLDSRANAGHEYAIGRVSGDQYYGARASINLWAPKIAKNSNEFSLSQLWVVAGSYDNNDLNTIEAGWQVFPRFYGDNSPRLFIYWTSDAYKTMGCYNLLCSGFVQTNNKIVIGGALSPTSSYGGNQSQITLLVWKDSKSGNWWLEYGSDIVVGYWPASLFSQLRDHASYLDFGGEVVNNANGGLHTTTQMGSGHFPSEGFGKASYFRNLQIVDSHNTLLPVPNLRLMAAYPNCYDIKGGANYFLYGGPGRNERCP